MRYYQGLYSPKNTKKYLGNTDNVIYRSRWELLVFRWCDLNPDVIEWVSEEITIPYICQTDNKQHTYYVDLYIKYKSGKRVLVEVKPEKQGIEPKPSKGKKTSTLLTEALVYQKNISKWTAARKYANINGMHFEVWGETALKSIGINVTETRNPKKS